MLLRDQDKKILVDIFERVDLNFEVWAYGSRVNGHAHDASDLDLVLRTIDLNPMEIELYERVIEDIRESNIPLIVELRDWAYLPDYFHREILREYEILYSNISIKNIVNINSLTS